MLTELHLENWKSFEKATLHIDPLTVLIGANAGGKSNALDALLFLQRVASGVSLTDALRGNSNMPALRGGLEWAARRPGKRFALGVTVRADAATDYVYRLVCEVSTSGCQLVAESLDCVTYQVDTNGKRQTQIACDQLFNSTPGLAADRFNAVFGKEGKTCVYLIDCYQTTLSLLFSRKVHVGFETHTKCSFLPSFLCRIFILDPIPTNMRGYSPFSDRLERDASNIAGVLAALPEERRGEIEATLSHYASHLPESDICRIYAEAVGRLQSDAMLYCDERWGEAGEMLTVDARGISDGTLRFLAILTALLTRPEGSLLVIEEVDNGLHPSRARLLLDMLREVGGRRGVDVLATTHNPALLDAMGGEMLPFITVAHRDAHSGHSVLTPLEDIAQLPKLMAQGPVGRLSSLGAIEKALADEPAETPA